VPRLRRGTPVHAAAQLRLAAEKQKGKIFSHFIWRAPFFFIFSIRKENFSFLLPFAGAKARRRVPTHYGP